MSARLPSINLNLSKKLRENRDYRQAFFLAESSALIAKQLIELRKRRGLNQVQVAEALETGQPAISRVERADYRNWSFNTLRRLADAMDARLRVVIEPAEDILGEYEGAKEESGTKNSEPEEKKFDKWIKQDNPYAQPAPSARPRHIVEEVDSAANSSDQIKQQSLRSLLDEEIEQQAARQSAKNTETAGAVWN